MLNFGPLHGKMHFDPPPFPRGKLTIFDTLKIDFADLPPNLHFGGGVGGVGGGPPMDPTPCLDPPYAILLTVVCSRDTLQHLLNSLINICLLFVSGLTNPYRPPLLPGMGIYKR